jgi:hypothetical protein
MNIPRTLLMVHNDPVYIDHMTEHLWYQSLTLVHTGYNRYCWSSVDKNLHHTGCMCFDLQIIADAEDCEYDPGGHDEHACAPGVSVK